MKFDYSFFEDTLHRMRKLRSYTIDKSYLLDAPKLIFPDMEIGTAPKVLEGSEDDSGQVILTRSYARKPGKNLKKLENVLKNQVPEDFRDFHRMYDEALVTTRTYPIHLWNEPKILEEISNWRDLYPYPLRFFRFGEFWDSYQLWFGLWQVDPGSDQWKVVITSHDNRDDDLDFGRPEEYIQGGSFHQWLERMIQSDGLPDPYFEAGPGGGFLDPA